MSIGSPRLSIITACRNAEKHIARCIESVAKQNTKFIEHIIVDGSSTDKTVSIIQQYASSYPHIRWLSEVDTGQSNAMNKGLTIATGDLVGFLNADDYYEGDVFSIIMPLVGSDEKRPLFIHGGVRVSWIADSHEWIQKSPSLTWKSPYNGIFPWNPVAYFYSKRLHLIAGYYDETNHYAMDLDFLLRSLRFAKLHYVDSVFGCFVMHSESKSLQQNKTESLQSKAETLSKAISDLPLYHRIQVNLYRWTMRLRKDFGLWRRRVF